MIIKIIVFTFFVAHVITVFTYGETRTATKQILKSYLNDKTQYKLMEGTFDIGIAYVSLISGSVGDNLLADPTYFNVTFSNSMHTRVDSVKDERTYDFYTLDYWGDRFSKHDVSKYNKIDKYLWPPKNSQFYLQGNMKSEKFAYIDIQISLWVNGTDSDIICKSEEELLNVVRYGYIDAMVEVAYFDFDDYTNPIKTYLLDDMYMYLNPGSFTWLDTYVQVNEADISDNRIYGEPYKVEQFYGISQKYFKTINQYLGRNLKSIAAITFVNDPQTIKYERQVYSLSEMFGFLGGLYDFLLFIGFCITHTFQDKILYNSIFSDLYQVRTKKNKDFSSTLNETRYSIAKDKVLSFRTERKMAKKCNIFTSPTRSNTLANEQAKYRSENGELVENLSNELIKRRAYNYRCHNMLPLCK